MSILTEKIKHVVVLMLENRSSDNILGTLYGPGHPTPRGQHKAIVPVVRPGFTCGDKKIKPRRGASCLGRSLAANGKAKRGH